MESWAEGIQAALAYIEDHLTEPLDIREIAKRAYVSPFYFQRIFPALCGVGVGEYIRCRRLSLAGEDLLRTGDRVIDIAAKYGYDSPDSFTRAFQRFHGVSPSAARKQGTSLRAYAPMRIKLSLEGGTMLEYRIVTKPQFTIVGLPRRFSAETSYREIPNYWDEVLAQPDSPVMGTFGVCIDDGDQDFEYLIADSYVPWKEIPAGCVTRVIPASDWAIFPCRGPLQETLQDTNTRMWTEWLPNCKNYRLAANLNLEYYTPPTENPADYYCELWLPVEPV